MRPPGLGGRSGDGGQYVSWVHDADFVRAIYWLIENEQVAGPVNVASPEPLPNAEFMRDLREAAGVPGDAKLYGLRHAFGTRAVLRGVDIKTLAELLGHTTTKMSEHYVHLAGQRAHLADAMAKVNGPATPPSDGRRPTP